MKYISRAHWWIICLPLTIFLVSAQSVQAQPLFSKTFSPAVIGAGATSTLAFTIDNAGGALVTDLAFTDIFPASVTIASPAAAFSDCLGTLTAPDGGSTITLTDGALGAGATCTIQVNVTSSTVGTHTNTTGDLTSSAGNSGSATDDLEVDADLPGFTKNFSPSTITSGSRSTLTFTIDNSANAAQIFNISFSDTFPTGMTIADPANALTTCTGGSFNASPGSSVFSYGPLFGGDAGLAANSICTVQVDVFAIGSGGIGNTSGEMTAFNASILGTNSSGKASAVLTVNSDPLNLTKRFTDDPAGPGGTVTLEFTIFNRDRASSATNIAFTDDLDATLTGLVATGLPANNVCGSGSLLSGASTLSLTGGNLPPEGSCTFSVTLQVPAGAAPGFYSNTTSTITGDVGGSGVVGGAALDTLTVVSVPTFTKTFLTDPTGPGSIVTLEFTITNTSATSSATDMSFSDDLEAFLSGVTIASLPGAGFCGAGSILFAGTGLTAGQIFANGANLAPSASCTFQVDLAIPAGTPSGVYTNTTSSLQVTVDGLTVLAPAATDTLTVVAGPTIMKSFTDDPVAPGGMVTLEFTLTHDPFAAADATAIAFTDDLNLTLTGLTAIGLPVMDICGTGSQITGTTNLSFTGGTLAPGASCTFSVILQVPMSALPGSYTNVTSSVMSTVSGVAAVSPGSSDILDVLGLSFTKTFVGDPALPGQTLPLEFTIDNTSASDATGMFFTDSLSSALTGLAASSLPPDGFCGAGSSISGTTFLIATGLDLTAGTSCTFTVMVDVPAGAADGDYTNVTSNLTATLGVSSVAADPAIDTLTVSTDLLFLTKAFTDDPVMPGGTVTLEFTVDNLDATNTATAITFTDDLDAVLSGLAATGLPQNNVCGAGSVLSGAGTLTLTGGTLPAGGSCTFSVTLNVPAAAPAGSFPNTTSVVTGDILGASVNGAAASDTLIVAAVTFDKSFDGPAAAGRTAVLTFNLQNVSTTDSVIALAFSDDLSAVIPGLVAVGLPQNDVCGTGSQLSGTSAISLTGGTLMPSGSCTLMVTVQVPAAATAGTFPNTTSDLFSNGVSVTEPATADLIIEPPPGFAKVFAPAGIGVGLGSTLTFTIDNTVNTLTAGSLDFTDNLPAGMQVASAPNASTTCTGGTITAVAGTSAVSYSGGSVAGGATCTLSVDVTATAVGPLTNASGDLTSDMGNSGPASATLTVVPQPGFSKAFSPTGIGINGISTLTFTIDNTASALAATALDFTDSLPAGMEVAATPNASTTCTGGTVTAVAGSTVVSYSGGTVAASSSCTLSVDVTGTAVGALMNTSGNLTSSLGMSGTASATLQVSPQPAFSKAFTPTAIAAGGVSTLTFTIDNSGGLDAATSLDFTDNLPAAVTVAATPNASTTCTGGMITAVAASGAVSYTGGSVAAGAVCTVQVDVTSSTVGMHVNTSGSLTSTLGDSGPASATLNVVPVPVFTKSFSPSSVGLLIFSSLTFTIDNSGSALPADALDFVDNLPAGMEVAAPPSATTTCTGGTLTAVGGTMTVSYTGGSVAAGTVCTIRVDVTAVSSGVLNNVTGDLTSTLGNSGPASATLTVNPQVLFSKAFAPDTILAGDVSVLTLTLDNSASTVDALNLDFTDNLPAEITVATPSNASTTCTGGTLTAVDGSGVITYTGGSVAAGAVCTVQADVTSTVGGSHVNTAGPLTSNLGGSGMTSATLNVAAPAAFTKDFAPAVIPLDGVTTLTFTIDNSTSVLDATGIGFTDNLPSGMLVADPANASTSCTGGTLVADPGTAVVSYTGGTVPASSICTVDVDVVVSEAGSILNTTEDLTSSLGNSGPASASLFVTATVLEIPTLGTLGMALLSLLLAIWGLRHLRRRSASPPAAGE